MTTATSSPSSAVNPPAAALKVLDAAVLFWALVDQSAGPDACWPWTAGHRGAAGYGSFYVPVGITGPAFLLHRAGSDQRANRLALELSLGRALAPGMYACHRCAVKGCCNPAHLYEGTPRDNRRDQQAVERAARPTWRCGHALRDRGLGQKRRCPTCDNDRRRRRRAAARSKGTDFSIRTSASAAEGVAFDLRWSGGSRHRTT